LFAASPFFVHGVKQMSALPKHRITPEEYLAMERASTERHEYLNGEIYLMVGASRDHNRIAGSAYATLYGQLRTRPCDIFTNDMRVTVSKTGLYTYPDIVVVCGEGQYQDSEVDTLLNPTLLIEVLSRSTEQYDRGEKFRHYQRIASLQYYVLIAQDKPRIEAYTRQSNNQWLYSVAEGLDASLGLPAIDCTLSLAEVYEKVTFEDDQDSGEHSQP
jgi:Uma2 family endonuclease